MIDKMTKFPDNISVDKPVPGEGCFEDGMFFKKSDTKYDGRNGDKSSNKGIQHIGKERNFIIDSLEFSEHQSHYNLKH